ncbi:DUF1269 domain-containing protein [Haloferax prahovense]|uniref:DUF1269 domain-containing protein n=1 Tax=Haloferax prahovense TaxID=381852 RepID=UPI000A928607|nr:DUF1269 domain-containing protein [Haloferax prahovense]
MVPPSEVGPFGRLEVKQAQSLGGVGALGVKFTDIGIDDAFIKEVANTVDPGDSALFLLSRAQMERIRAGLSDDKFESIETNLSPRTKTDSVRRSPLNSLAVLDPHRAVLVQKYVAPLWLIAR